MRIHANIEQAFERWGHFVVRRRLVVAVAMLLVSGLFISQVPNLTADNSVESFLRPNDPARETYDQFRDQFGQDQMILLAIHPPRVFDLAFLEKLRALHEDLERELPHLDEVTSLLNARNTRGEGDQLIVEDLTETWPESDADLAQLERRVRDTPLYENTLIDAAGTITTVTIRSQMHSSTDESSDEVLAGFDDENRADDTGAGSLDLALLTEEERGELVRAVTRVIARHQAPDFEIHLSGGNVTSYHTNQNMMRDMMRTMPGALCAIAFLLYVLFRRISGVVLPLFVVLASQLTTFGIMAVARIPTSVSGQILPSLLLTVGICSTVHVLTIVYQRLAAGEAKEDAIPMALGHSGLAVMMAALTTAGGLISFASADLAQVANLGRVAPIGIMLAFVYSVTLLPALLAMVPLKPRRAGVTHIERLLGRFLAQLGGMSTRHPWRVLAACAVVAAVCSAGIGNLRFSQYYLGWFPEDDPVRLDVEYLEAHLGGSDTLEMVVDTGRENGLHDPETLRRIERAMLSVEAMEDPEILIGKAISITDVVKETHRALNENRQTHYAIPESRALVAQELLLFEQSGTDDLEELTDSQFRLARVSLRIPMVDAIHYADFVERVEDRFRRILGNRAEISSTGLTTLFARTFAVVNVTMARSYVIALLIITPLMVVLIGNLKRGLLAMIPNLVPILMTLGLMGWLDIPIDNSTLLIGCVLIGLVVDDTIHFMHKFQRYYEGSGDAHEAVRLTLETTGSALLFTSVVLAAGWLVLIVSYMQNVMNFGRLAFFATTVAFLADILIAPAMMVLVSRPRDGTPQSKAEG